jgi:hypothetical protein
LNFFAPLSGYNNLDTYSEVAIRPPLLTRLIERQPKASPLRPLKKRLPVNETICPYAKMSCPRTNHLERQPKASPPRPLKKRLPVNETICPYVNTSHPTMSRLMMSHPTTSNTMDIQNFFASLIGYNDPDTYAKASRPPLPTLFVERQPKASPPMPPKKRLLVFEVIFPYVKTSRPTMSNMTMRSRHTTSNTTTTSRPSKINTTTTSTGQWTDSERCTFLKGLKRL